MRAFAKLPAWCGLGCGLAGILLAASAFGAATAPGDVPGEAHYPPWQHGANNDAPDRGLEFTVPEADNLADFHGNPMTARLVLYVGGNYFFAMAPLVAAFEAAHPDLRGHLYWETIPPGLLARQIAVGGTVTVGNMTWTAPADVYAAGLAGVTALVHAGQLAGPAMPYVTNTLTIMVPKNNPGHVTGLADLARPELRLAMPNPAFEGIARQIQASLAKAGGAALQTAVYETKLRAGSTILTHMHHRQTPFLLMQGMADAGVTWQSEAIFQERAGNPISHVDIPAAQNSTGIYAAAMVKGAPHAAAARAWLDFLRSPDALRIFSDYGFLAYRGAH